MAWDKRSGQIQLDHPEEEGVLLLGLVATEARGDLQAVGILPFPLGRVDRLEQLLHGFAGAVHDLLQEEDVVAPHDLPQDADDLRVAHLGLAEAPHVEGADPRRPLDDVAAPGAVLGQVRTLSPPVIRLPGAACSRHLVALAAVGLWRGCLPALIPATDARCKAGEKAHLGGGGELKLGLRMADEP